MSIPIIFPDDPQTNITGYSAKGKYLPDQIAGYVPGPTENTCFIYLKGGQVLFSEWSTDQLEQAMKQYWLELGKAMAKSKTIIAMPGTGR